MLSDKPRYRVKARRRFTLVDGTPLDGEEAPNVEILPVVTTLDLPADRVLRGALGELASVVVVGYGHDGEEFFASNVADGADVVWHLERAKLKLLQIETGDLHRVSS